MSDKYIHSILVKQMIVSEAATHLNISSQVQLPQLQNPNFRSYIEVQDSIHDRKSLFRKTC